MNSFGDKIVFAQIKEGREQLKALNAALKQAFEAAGFDCEDRYTPHVTVIKVSLKKKEEPSELPCFQTGGKKAKGGIPREAFNQFVNQNFGTQVLHTGHNALNMVTSNC